MIIHGTLERFKPYFPRQQNKQAEITCRQMYWGGGGVAFKGEH